MRVMSDLMASLSQLTDGIARALRKTAETPPMVTVYDLIGAVTGQSTNARSVIYTRLAGIFPEVSTCCCSFKFPGRGQQLTPVTCVRGAVLIVMLLPGRAAAPVRKEAAPTLVRYLGGDISMVDEIARNHLVQQELEG